jgi:AraC-like DNA-binding protein
MLNRVPAFQFNDLYSESPLKMILYIKNMVCIRCKMAVKAVLDGLYIDYIRVELGWAETVAVLTAEQKLQVNEGLQHYALELMQNKKMILVERIKTLIIEKCHAIDSEPVLKFSVFLSEALQYDYTYLANIFSETEGSTIERFYIANRIERVKELMVYEAMSIKEIAYQLNYSSVSHLCLQFKKVTGQTPSLFKTLCESGSFVWKTCE